MAMIKCPERGKDVSDQAKNCVHCGYPLSKKKKVKNDPADIPAAPVEERKDKPANGRKKGLILAVAGVLLAAAVIVAILLVTGNKPADVQPRPPAGIELVKEGTSNVKAGKHVIFGRYPQTKAGTDETPIEWIVLEVKGGKALLISMCGLDTVPYNTEEKDVTWEACSLRNWLNSNFLNTAFTPEEQAAIPVTEVDNSAAQGYSNWKTDGGNNTRDRVFLLSCAEANRYFDVTIEDFQNIKARVEPTAYAFSKGALVSKDSDAKTESGAAAGYWWLRSPGFRQDSAACVCHVSLLVDVGVDSETRCVRPALWIDLNSEILKSDNLQD